jgi:hypothetical protein
MGLVLQFTKRVSEPTKCVVAENAEKLLAKQAEAKKSERFLRSVEAAKKNFLRHFDEKTPA